MYEKQTREIEALDKQIQEQCKEIVAIESLPSALEKDQRELDRITAQLTRERETYKMVMQVKNYFKDMRSFFFGLVLIIAFIYTAFRFLLDY